MEKAKSVRSFFIVFAVIFFLVSAFMLYKGYDKMTNYKNTDYRSVNAYVGGDAYNYIINSNYATGYYVLSAGFLISGILCLGAGAVVNAIAVINMNGKGAQFEEHKEQDDELPDL